MKSIALKAFIFLVFCLMSVKGFSQWTDNGTKSYTNDHIGIGISDPGSYMLNINGNTFNNGTQYF